MQALGFVETIGLIAAIECADVMLKTAQVSLIERVKIGAGLVTITIQGDIGAVKAAVEAGAAAVVSLNPEALISKHVIARPNNDMGKIISFPDDKADIQKESEQLAEEFKESDNIEKLIQEEEKIIDDLEEIVEQEEKTLTDEEKYDEIKDVEIVIKQTIRDVEAEIFEEKAKDDSQNDITTEIVDTAKNKPVEIENKQEFEDLIDKIGLEKAMAELNKLTTVKLRSLAREFEDLEIAGRAVSKARKDTIIMVINSYYKNK